MIVIGGGSKPSGVRMGGVKLCVRDIDLLPEREDASSSPDISPNHDAESSLSLVPAGSIVTAFLFPSFLLPFPSIPPRVDGSIPAGTSCTYFSAWKVGMYTAGLAPSPSPSTLTVPKGSRLECFPRRNGLTPVRFFTSSMITSKPLPVTYIRTQSSGSVSESGDADLCWEDDGEDEEGEG